MATGHSRKMKDFYETCAESLKQTKEVRAENVVSHLEPVQTLQAM